MSDWISVCTFDELNSGEGRAVKVNGQTIAVFRLDNGEIHAIDDECPHAYGSLGGGMVIETNIVVCPDHGWPFDVRTGLCASNDRICVRKFEVRQVEGEIQVNIGKSQENAS